jgi:antitoxin YefM
MVVSYSAFRKKLAEYLDAVTNDRTELHVTRQGSRTVVVLDEEEFNSIMETLHLFSSRANARCLLDSLDDIDAGRVIEFDPRKADVAE